MRSFMLLAAFGLCATLPADAPQFLLDSQSRRHLLSFSTSYCYYNQTGQLKDGSLHIGCPDTEPKEAPVCTVDSTPSASSMCKVLNRNGIDKNRFTSDYKFAHCSEALVVVQGEGTDCNAASATCAYYCKKLETTDGWNARRRDGATDRVDANGKGWWSCGWWSGYEWHNGACRDKTRYLGEECWDDSGECYNSGVPAYDGLRLSCATDTALQISTPTCIPSAFKLENRNECTCNWFDWNIGFACGASQCNGHACVLNAGDGKKYCDYQTDNNW